MNYQVVASFVVQDETNAAITKAFRIIKGRTTDWEPKCFMLDKCDEEIKSIRKIFPRM